MKPIITMIEWHNLLENPDDLPEDDDLLYLAFFDDRYNRIYLDDENWKYDKEGDLFVQVKFDDFNQYYDKERLVQDYGQLIAWAKHPDLDVIEAKLNEKILGKEATKNV